MTEDNMQFSIRPYSIHDFLDWYDRDEIDLSPKFQRRQVWSRKARSFLIDTILRQRPMPAIYIRKDISPKTKKVVREVVDGQQRLTTIFDFMKDGFEVMKVHNEEYGGYKFSNLPENIQKYFLQYEISTNLLIGATDRLVHEIFARLNTYTIKLNPQELRNAKYHGDFKQMIYKIGYDNYDFWTYNNIFSDAQISRMREAEFISEIFIAMMNGIKSKNSKDIDKIYRKYDDNFDNKYFKSRFETVLTQIKSIYGNRLRNSRFNNIHLFYSLMLVIYNFSYDIPEGFDDRVDISNENHAKISSALTDIENILDEENDNYQEFKEACSKHTTSSKERKIRHDFIKNKILEYII